MSTFARSAAVAINTSGDYLSPTYIGNTTTRIAGLSVNISRSQSQLTYRRVGFVSLFMTASSGGSPILIESKTLLFLTETGFMFPRDLDLSGFRLAIFPSPYIGPITGSLFQLIRNP